MNRNRLIDAFASNIANVVVHKVLEKAINSPEIIRVYSKEIKNSFTIAKNYRNKINPSDRALPLHDLQGLKQKIMRRAKAELNLRVEKGYKNIDLSLVAEYVDDLLEELNIV